MPLEYKVMFYLFVNLLSISLMSRTVMGVAVLHTENLSLVMCSPFAELTKVAKL